MADSDIPVLPPEEAIRFFEGKGLAKSFAWADIWASQHDFFFTVAKMLSVSLLEDTHAIILEALKDGRSPQQLGKDLKSLLAGRGWWGKARQTDPLTGKVKAVQLGSNARVRTIVNTNLRTSYSAGRYARQERVKEAFPILVYKSRMDGRERPQHHAWHNTALPIGHAWWSTHYPPCDWGCRCRTVSMTEKMAARRGLKVGEAPPHFGTRKWVNRRTGEEMEVEVGIGAGWDYHPGKAVLDGLAPDPLFGFSKASDGTSIAAADRSAIARFLSVFGVGEDGGIWRDATGWPLAISPAWLMGLATRQQQLAPAAAMAIVRPDAIRLVWVSGKDGRPMLVRRYVSAALVVDIGNSFWRFAPVTSEQRARLSISALIWSADTGAIASYNPRQPRDQKGRWTSASIWVAMVFDSAGNHPGVAIGRLSDSEMDRIAATGAKIPGRKIALDSSLTRHIHAKHGAPHRDSKGRLRGEWRKGQRAVTADDIARAPAILRQSSIVPSREGRANRFEGDLIMNQERIVTVWEARRHAVVLADMWIIRRESGRPAR